MAARYLVQALAIAGRAVAQSSCSASATLTIQSQADATGLSGCSTFEGSIEIAPATSGAIAISGVTEIDGDLIVSDVPGLTSFSANDLETVTGDMQFGGLTMLSTLAFTSLEDVKGTINLTTLPNLQALTFTKQVKTAGKLIIASTQLYSLQGINLEEVGSILISQNGFLNDITMQLANVSGAIEIGSNAADNCSVTFPNLIWAESLNIMDVQSLLIPSLESTNQSIYLGQNQFTSLSAPNLTSVGADLTFDGNSDLTNITVPKLTTITGGLSITSNDDLKKINTFTALKTIGGAVVISGSADDVEFPALMDVKGAFTLNSTADVSSSCKTFKAESGSNKVIKGVVSCSTSTATTSSSGSGGSGTGSSSTPSTGAANPVFITGATGLLGVVAAMFGML